eukprot:6811537-Pyramimonas_sp.AAC.1
MAARVARASEEEVPPLAHAGGHGGPSPRRRPGRPAACWGGGRPGRAWHRSDVCLFSPLILARVLLVLAPS